MKIVRNSIVITAFFAASACTPSTERNEAASDTSSVFDTTRLNSALDTTAVNNVKANGAVQAATPTQYEESNGKQSSRTNVGTDTTGLQPHDNLRNRQGVDGSKEHGSAVGGSNKHPLGRERE